MNSDFGAVLPVMSPPSVWKQSPASTAARQLAIVTLLRPFLEDAGMSTAVDQR
jgi:hypothetical protein